MSKIYILVLKESFFYWIIVIGILKVEIVKESVRVFNVCYSFIDYKGLV